MNAVSSRKRFSLIELLVVIAVIALLSGLLLPALAKAKKTSLSLRCLGNFKQLGVGLSLYAGDYNQYYPCWKTSGSAYWFHYSMLGQYVNGPKGVQSDLRATVFWCPADPRRCLLNGTVSDVETEVRCIDPNYALTFEGATNNDTYFTLKTIRYPAAKIIVSDARGSCAVNYSHVQAAGIPPYISASSSAYMVARHQRKVNFLCFDGHAESHDWVNPSDAFALRYYATYFK